MQCMDVVRLSDATEDLQNSTAVLPFSALPASLTHFHFQVPKLEDSRRGLSLKEKSGRGKEKCSLSVLCDIIDCF